MRTRPSKAVASGLVVSLVMVFLVPTSSAAAVLNGIENADLSSGLGDDFECFTAAGWGELEYRLQSVAGRGGAGRAAALTVTNRISGDRKLLQSQTPGCPPTVVAGQTYRLGVWYSATTPVNLTVFIHSAAGWTYYGDLQTLPPAGDFTQVQVPTPAMPASADQISWGLSLAGDGTVITDDYSIAAVGPDPAPAPNPELIVNGNLAAGVDAPTCFQQSGWGESNTQQSFVGAVPPGSTGRSWRITMADHQSGDHKLLVGEAVGCAPAVQPGGLYDLSVTYRSTGDHQAITLFRHTASGWQYWTDVQELAAAAEWTTVPITIPPVPDGTDRISFGVSMSADGQLDTTGYSLRARAGEPVPGHRIPRRIRQRPDSGRWPAPTCHCGRFTPLCSATAECCSSRGPEMTPISS